MGESWIVSNLNAALSTWNDKLAEIWSLLTESPQTFKGGQVWGVMTGIHGALQAIGYGLLVLFFAVGVMKTCGSFVEVKKPEHALKLFIRFALAKGAVTYGLELMLAVFSIVQGMVSTIITQSGSSGMSSVSLPQELIDAINNVGFWDSIPLWAVTLIGGLLITVLSFTMILTVYGRMFSLWMYAAIAPIPLSTFAGEPTSSVGKNFIRSYAGVCLQGVVIALSCIIFSAISSSPPAVDTGASVVTAVWTYVGELAFNLLVLVGAIKGCDRIVKEIMGLLVAGAAFLWYNRATKGAETMPEIIPIRDLKNTNAISQRCHETAEPIFVTKNGYGDMVIMSMETYEHQQIMNEVYAKLATAEAQHEAGMGRPLADILKETGKKYAL